jgi:hypothetical protein
MSHERERRFVDLNRAGASAPGDAQPGPLGLDAGGDQPGNRRLAHQLPGRIHERLAFTASFRRGTNCTQTEYESKLFESIASRR